MTDVASQVRTAETVRPRPDANELASAKLPAHGTGGKPRIVIVGGGFAGLAAAHALRHVDAAEVILIDRRNHTIFQPLLYQVATAVLSPAEIAAPIQIGRAHV